MIIDNIPVYGLMISLAIISNFIIVLSMYDKDKFSLSDIFVAIIYEVIGIVFGAKLLTLILNYEELPLNFNFFNIGFSSYGAVIGALINLILYCKIFEKNIKDVLLLFIIPIPLMYAIGKIGCFFAGCCYGIEYTGIGNVVYKNSIVAPKGVNLFPVQIVETITFLMIFIYMVIKYKKNKFGLKEFGFSIILCGFAKFILDYLRFSHNNIIISENQMISIIFIIIGILIYMKSLKNSRKQI